MIEWLIIIEIGGKKMNLFTEVIIGLILAGLVYFGIHYFVVNRQTKRLSLKTQPIVDAATNYAVKQQKLIASDSTIISSYNAGVWGRGVMAFEYHVDAVNVEKNDLPIVKSKLESSLNQFGIDNDLESVDSSKYFAITDMWLMETQLYFDVAYLRNRVTLEYVEDLKRLDE